MVGLVFVKLTRGKKRTATILFSRTAVICRRDGFLCLMFRIADLRNKSNLLQATVRAQLISKRFTIEGEELSLSRQELEVRKSGNSSTNRYGGPRF
jgi:potassium inwardly-rectifying channel subfamily J